MVSTAYRKQCRVMVAEARQVEGEDTHQMVIAARERSRNGDELNLRGVDFKNYLKNPVVLVVPRLVRRYSHRQDAGDRPR